MKWVNFLTLGLFALSGLAQAQDATAKKITVYSRQSALMQLLQADGFTKHLQSDVTLKTLDLASVQARQEEEKNGTKFVFEFHYEPKVGSALPEACTFEATAKPTTVKHPKTKITYSELRFSFGKIDCVH